MAFTQRLAWERLRTVNSASMTDPEIWYPFLISGLAAPLVFPSYILKLVNNSTVLVLVSIDGVNAVDVAPGGSFFLYDESKGGVAVQLPAVQAGTQVFVQSAAVGTGSIYLVSQYIVQS